MEITRVKGVIPVVVSAVLLLALTSLLLLPISYDMQTQSVLGIVVAVGAIWALFALKKQSAVHVWYVIALWIALIGVATTIHTAGESAPLYIFVYIALAVILVAMPTIELLVVGMASLAVVVTVQAIVTDVSLSIPSYAALVVTIWIVACLLGAGTWQLLHDVDYSQRKLGRVKANNTALKEAEKDKTEILSLVSHQLKTPLALIRWSVESVLNNPHLTEKERQRLENAIGTTHVMYNTIEDLSHIFKLIMRGTNQYMRAEKIDVTELVTEVKTEFAAILDQRQIKLVVKRTRGEATAKADHVFLKHALVNLIDNAIKYSPDKADITVSTRAERDRVYVVVTDHGIGIEPANQGRIFERFFRTDKAREVNEHGTGLGLYLVKVIMEKMGGNVTLVSDVGKGSTFTLSIPRG